MNAPGRDARGRFIRDDAALVRAIGALAEAVDRLAVIAADLAMDAEARILLAHEASASIVTVRECLAVIDSGRKRKDPDHG